MRVARTLLIATAVAALLATGCEWHFETLDGNGGPNGRTMDRVGNDNSTVLYNGNPHVFSYDATDGDLRHAYWNGLFWAFETLDGAGGPNGRTTNGVGQYSAVLLYNGRPHVFYYDSTDGDLRHAYWNGLFWAFETLDGNGGPNGRIDGDLGYYNAAVLYNGRPHVFYGDAIDGDLHHAYWNGLYWAFEALDGNGGPNGRVDGDLGYWNAVTLYNGRPHVFYYAVTGSELRHAYWNGLFWAFETLDGDGGPNGRTTNSVGEDNAAVVYNGRPHVFYGDQTDEFLRHGYYDGQAWYFEILDGDGGPNGRTTNDVGTDNAVILYNGRPDVFYLDGTDDALRHAYFG